MFTRSRPDIITPLRLYINYALLIEWSNRVKQEDMKSMIPNWIQKRRLLKQLRRAGISDKATEEILHFYGVNSK
jgi:hypothetical protein